MWFFSTVGLVYSLLLCPISQAFTNYPYDSYISLNGCKTKLNMAVSSLRPLAEPLMDSGKALARSGELLIDFTTAIGEYGGGLSSAGAAIRNSGDYLAQAAASTRFKTAAELVSNEMREAGDCLLEASEKMLSAKEELEVSEGKAALYLTLVESSVTPFKTCGEALEAAGAAIVQGLAVAEIGQRLEEGSKAMQEISSLIQSMAEVTESAGDTKKGEAAVLSSQRLAFAAAKLMEAGNRLTGTPVEKPKGKGWLKGGLQ